jgi:hypothetical protein
VRLLINRTAALFVTQDSKVIDADYSEYFSLHICSNWSPQVRSFALAPCSHAHLGVNQYIKVAGLMIKSVMRIAKIDTLHYSNTVMSMAI